MIQEYTDRNMTDPNDILAAFSAIITVHGRTMIGGIFYGIPEAYFGPSLLWRPAGSESRRRAGLSGINSRQFPSWSWIGWSGHIWMHEPRCYIRHNVASSYKYTYTHLVDFYKTRICGDFEVRELIQESHMYQLSAEQRKDLYETIPPSKMLSYPVPLVDGPEDVALHTEASYASIVECHTQKAWFSVEKTSLTEFRFCLAIIDTAGSRIGQLEIWSESRDDVIGKRIELIRISALVVEPRGTSLRSGLWHYLHNQCPRHCSSDMSVCELKEYWRMKVYNVLWVHFEDGVAYRQGVGTVLQDAWDAAETEEVDIRLG
jgi:hypothetical protein